MGRRPIDISRFGGIPGENHRGKVEDHAITEIFLSVLYAGVSRGNWRNL
jgi:hypothetical protein